jgi:hypothetical protein
MQRNKGKRGELEAVRALRPVFPNAARKVVNHAGAENGVDLIGTGALRVQVKNHQKYTPVTTLDSVTDTSGIPVVMTRAFRREWRVVMRLDDFLRILADVGVAYEDAQ